MITTPWQVQFLGGLRIFRDGMPAPVCRLRTAKTTALLAYLCAHPGRDHGRDDLVDRFWPDLPFDAGRNSLRIALSALRRVFDAPEQGSPSDTVLYTTRSQVRLCVGTVHTDVAALEAALRPGKGDQAAALAAQGPFLPGVNDEWVCAERDRIDELRQTALARLVSPEPVSPSPLPATEPALARTVPGSVPSPLGRFFGRDEESARLLSLLSDPALRLITVTGPGGTGKTRLAVEVARSLREGKAILPLSLLRGGVWFVPLVAATHGAHILPAVCQAVGAELTGNSDALETLAARWQDGGRTLLFLDNLEQIDPTECAAVLLGLLERIPHIVCLTTSRRRVGLAGERVVALEPFPLPHRDDSLPSLAHQPAVALFVDRAREADVDFVLTPRRALPIVELCVRLNGVPLALEMAASWAGVSTPEEMVATVRGGEETLSGRHAGRESRHRSLRAVAEWSLRLLPNEARTLLAALSVFDGRWTKDAAAFVAVPYYSAERLALLCDHSLIAAETDDGAREGESVRRFQIPPALHPFAREVGGTAAETRRRHARYFTEAALARSTTLETLPDTLSALAFWEADGAHGTNNALRLVGALWSFWWRFGQWDEAQATIHRVLAHIPDDDTDPDAVSQALRCAGKLAFYRRDFAGARAMMQRRITVETRRGNLVEILHLRANFATLDVEEGRFADAKAAFEEILPLLPTQGIHRHQESGYVFSNYADTLLALGETNAAHALTETCLREIGDGGQPYSGIVGLHEARLAAILRAHGDFDAACTHAERSLAIFRECGEVLRIADGLLLLAGIRRERGDTPGACAALRESFTLRRCVPTDAGFRASVAEAERLLGEIPLTATLRDAFALAFARLEEGVVGLVACR